MKPDYYDSLVINSIEDIATKMRVLANLVGGGHLTNKEAEVELHKLANILSGYNIRINTLADDCIKAIMQTSGSNMIVR